MILTSTNRRLILWAVASLALLAAMVVLLLAPPAAFAQDAETSSGICDRTAQVRDAILDELSDKNIERTGFARKIKLKTNKNKSCTKNTGNPTLLRLLEGEELRPSPGPHPQAEESPRRSPSCSRASLPRNRRSDTRAVASREPNLPGSHLFLESRLQLRSGRPKDEGLNAWSARYTRSLTSDPRDPGPEDYKANQHHHLDEDNPDERVHARDAGGPIPIK